MYTELVVNQGTGEGVLPWKNNAVSTTKTNYAGLRVQIGQSLSSCFC